MSAIKTKRTWSSGIARVRSVTGKVFRCLTTSFAARALHSWARNFWQRVLRQLTMHQANQVSPSFTLHLVQGGYEAPQLRFLPWWQMSVRCVLLGAQDWFQVPTWCEWLPPCCFQSYIFQVLQISACVVCASGDCGFSTFPSGNMDSSLRMHSWCRGSSDSAMQSASISIKSINGRARFGIRWRQRKKGCIIQ